MPPSARSSAAAAWITPALVALVPAPPSSTEKRPSSREASRSHTTLWPAISPAEPFAALIAPSFSTVAPISATSPPSAPTLPRLITLAVEGPLKPSAPPDRKSALETSRVEATKVPPTFTTPVLPMITPLGLMT